MQKKNKNLYSIILVAALVVIAAGMLLFMKLTRKPGSTLIITENGQVVLEKELKKGEMIKIDSEDDGYNIFEVIETEEESGFGLRCIESNCPEQVCIMKGIVTLSDDPIVCLPHKVIAKLSYEYED
ncbi:MAG: NusG domain II-containing protein [Eubacteriales bacterium]|nr:NusG domain II-containing protein [Eubacteriales bacterium]